MRIWYPEEIKKLTEIYKPYRIDIYLGKDVPKEAMDAFNKVMQWLDEVEGDWQ